MLVSQVPAGVRFVNDDSEEPLPKESSCRILPLGGEFPWLLVFHLFGFMNYFHVSEQCLRKMCENVFDSL